MNRPKPPAPSTAPPLPSPGRTREPDAPPKSQIVVIGGSAGSVEALFRVLPGLPRDFRLPILLVVHMPPDRESSLTEILSARCGLAVKEAEDKEPAQPGTVHVAPPNYHLLVETGGRLSLSSEERVLFCRPSIDVLFESAVDAYGSGVLAVVLTGANSDGARGMAAVCAAGGRAFVQRPETAEVATMPEAALKACPGAEQVELDQLPALLLQACNS